MEKSISNVFGLVFKFFLVLFLLSFFHYSTGKLEKFDLINEFFMRVEIHNITDLFKQKSLQVRSETKFIVVHNDAIDQSNRTYTPAFEIAEYHTISKGWRSVAYHYYIGKNGKVYNLVNDKLETVHVGKPNDKISLAICLQGNFDNEKPTKQQLISLLKVLKKLKKEYPEAQLVGHRDLNKKTSCPGKNFDLDKIKEITNFHFLKIKNGLH